MKTLEQTNEKSCKLREKRREAHLTQQQLAKIAGVHYRVIQRIELGEAQVGNLTARNFMAIVDALNIDPHSLF